MLCCAAAVKDPAMKGARLLSKTAKLLLLMDALLHALTIHTLTRHQQAHEQEQETEVKKALLFRQDICLPWLNADS